MNQDVNIFVSELESEDTNPDPNSGPNPSSIAYTVGNNRQGYIVCLEGSIQIETTSSKTPNTPIIVVLDQYDAGEIDQNCTLKITTKSSTTANTAITANKKAHFILLEMEHTGGGRTDLD